VIVTACLHRGRRDGDEDPIHHVIVKKYDDGYEAGERPRGCRGTHAVATLVLAFTDPVARWMYDDPHQYLRHIPRLFKALGMAAFESGGAHRTGDGFGVALWLPPGVHV
jgi:hypothetical protein